jgi:hypothetical protein
MRARRTGTGSAYPAAFASRWARASQRPRPPILLGQITPSARPKSASNLRWAALTTATTGRIINGLCKAEVIHRARAMALVRRRRVRGVGMSMVQQSPAAGAHRQHPARRGRGVLLPHAGPTSHRNVIQTPPQPPCPAPAHAVALAFQEDADASIAEARGTAHPPPPCAPAPVHPSRPSPTGSPRPSAPPKQRARPALRQPAASRVRHLLATGMHPLPFFCSGLPRVLRLEMLQPTNVVRLERPEPLLPRVDFTKSR